jgi:hypothetical protein
VRETRARHHPKAVLLPDRRAAETAVDRAMKDAIDEIAARDPATASLIGRDPSA